MSTGTITQPKQRGIKYLARIVVNQLQADGKLGDVEITNAVINVLMPSIRDEFENELKKRIAWLNEERGWYQV